MTTSVSPPRSVSRPAESRLDAEDREIVSGDELADGAEVLGARGSAEPLEAVSRQVHHARGSRTKVQEVGIRGVSEARTAVVAGVHGDCARRLPHALRRTQQDRVDEREDRGRSADPEAEHRHRESGKAWREPEAPEREAQVRQHGGATPTGATARGPPEWRVAPAATAITAMSRATSRPRQGAYIRRAHAEQKPRHETRQQRGADSADGHPETHNRTVRPRTSRRIFPGSAPRPCGPRSLSAAAPPCRLRPRPGRSTRAAAPWPRMRRPASSAACVGARPWLRNSSRAINPDQAREPATGRSGSTCRTARVRTGISVRGLRPRADDQRNPARRFRR